GTPSATPVIYTLSLHDALPILLILNGIRFPFGLLNAAIDWCKQNGSALHAIFMKAEDEVGEGYVYPSDLEAAEDLNDTQDSENRSEEHTSELQSRENLVCRLLL